MTDVTADRERDVIGQALRAAACRNIWGKVPAGACPCNEAERCRGIIRAAIDYAALRLASGPSKEGLVYCPSCMTAAPSKIIRGGSDTLLLWCQNCWRVQDLSGIAVPREDARKKA